ncbi:MAG: hypothetical protein LBS72_05155 [Oscillospiraceae bacterium]|nr:hypothetical protein [Oscillospiraceae bacterium]
MRNRQSLEHSLERKETVRRGEANWAAKQLAGEKMTARERVDALLDPNSFVELDCLFTGGGLAEGVVTGYGTINGRPAYVFAQDYTVKAGAITKAHAAKIRKALALARKCGAPVVGMFDSAGARLEEGASTVDAYSELYKDIARLSGVVPMIGVILGASVGAAAILPAMMDIVIASESSAQWTTVGAAAVSRELDERVDPKELGGAVAHAKRGGVSIVCPDEQTALRKARETLALLPDNNLENPPDSEPGDLNRKLTIVDPDAPDKLILDMLDAGTALPLCEAYAPSALTYLGRLGGQSVGVVAATGLLNADTCRKVARFIRMCDCFNLPVISLINTTGFAAVRSDAQTDLIKASAQLAYAVSEATCPTVRVITGDAIGAGYAVFGGRDSADVIYAWPGAVISPISPEAAAALYYKDEIASSTGDVNAVRQSLAERYASEVADGVSAAAQGLVDDVIDPADTRRLVIAALGMLESKRDQNPPKKHGNLPL